MSKIYEVKNRSAGMLTYRIPEDNIRREFLPGEVKKISEEELTKLSYRPGGRKIMTEYLLIKDATITANLNIHTEPEYWMEEANITKVILEGSLDEFKDFLDFAPRGAVDIAKKICVELPLNDVAKRDAMKKMTGYDVSAAIANAKADAEDEGPVAPTGPVRRVKTEEKTTGRRTEPKKYTVVNRTE